MAAPKKKKQKKYIGKKFEAIHRSRELAVQFLYSLDVYPGQNFDESLELIMNIDDVAKDDTPEVKERCRKLAGDVWTRKNEIDGVLLRIVTGWRPERMMSVDRTILRLMVLEGFIAKTLPVRSAISEAASLARDFGTKDSSRFVNGVMHKIAEHFADDDKNDNNDDSGE
ncbi:MAG: transcription antitermination factor NusB [Synergistaceae bacterium]|nr:transcription antitermination factor NusB [Synergistaceae bacterium]